MNRFQCSIPCFEGPLMPFKMRYKAMYNYNPIKFYELNNLYYHMDAIGWRKIFFCFPQNSIRSIESSSSADVFKERKTRKRKKTHEFLRKQKKCLRHPVESIWQHKLFKS
jgi:hypothetical protein